MITILKTLANDAQIEASKKCDVKAVAIYDGSDTVRIGFNSDAQINALIEELKKLVADDE